MEEYSHPLIESTNSHSNDTQRRVYKRRWIILTIVSLINICNAAVWISMAPVADKAAHFYETDQNNIDLFSSIFFVSTIVIGFIAIWIVDRNGLMLGIYLGSILNALGISLRALSSADFIVNSLTLSKRSQFIVAIVGQMIAGLAQPFVLFSPTKVAELWFSTNQRAFATTITGMSNPMGIVLGTIISPLIVTTSNKIPLLSIVWCIPSVVTLSSKPPTPPSDSAEIVNSTPYFTAIKELFKQKAYLMLLLYMGCGVGMFSALITILEEILESKGYDDSFASVCTAIMIGSGVLGAAAVSHVVDRNKRYMTAMKLSVGLTAIAINGLLVSFNYSDIKHIISIFCAIFGFFGFMSYPLGLELGIECSFPVVPEATSSGFLMICGQIQGIIFTYLSTQLANTQKFFNNIGVNL
ncbi:unnamed protein product [Oppiella nova]|uniref:Major facilitator superfamily (MFS) profile domain-containing protein n=1 Tax=Oppiella nova TaxID=334625 RepID=A0A7R9LQ84_9ACAR|nr:unnamed protein product [Oppiella nova]CAG2165889.1 unnamed protein product [Oppiella nova]